jgi:hypothetical protein
MRVECAGVWAGVRVGVVQSLASKTVRWERDWYLSVVWCSWNMSGGLDSTLQWERREAVVGVCWRLQLAVALVGKAFGPCRGRDRP